MTVLRRTLLAMTVKRDHFYGAVIASEAKQSHVKARSKKIDALLPKMRLLRRT